MSVALSVRLPESVNDSLNSFVAEQTLNRSAVVARALDEWLRTQTHPGIRFVTLATGERTAALATGPEIWTVAEAWVLADSAQRSVEHIMDTTGLARHDVTVALQYYADFQTDIDAELKRQWQAQESEQARWNRLRQVEVA